METVRNMDRAPLGHSRLVAAPKVETVAIMIADKSRGHPEDMENGKCAANFNIASQPMCLSCTN